MADDRELGFEFSYPTASSAQFSRLRRRLARTQSVVDVVLAQPFRQRDRVDAQFDSGLFGGFACPDQCDCSGPELGGISTWHVDQPFGKAAG